MPRYSSRQISPEATRTPPHSPSTGLLGNHHFSIHAKQRLMSCPDPSNPTSPKISIEMSQNASESELSSSQGSAQAVDGSSQTTNPHPATSEWNFNTIMTVLISLRFLLIILIAHPPPHSRDPNQYTTWLMDIIGLVLDYVRKNSRQHFEIFDRSYQTWKDENELREGGLQE
jgi:hypothetical protein